MALTQEQREEIGRRYWTKRESASDLGDEFGISREWAHKVAKQNKPPANEETPVTANAGRGLTTPA